MEAAYNLRGTVQLPQKDSWKPKSGKIATAASAQASRKPQGGNDNPKRRKPFKDYKDRVQGAPDYPCSIQEVKDLVAAWVADGCLNLPEVEKLPTQQDKNSPKYCVYHRRIQHPTSDCWTLKGIFQKKIEANELRIGNRDVREQPYPQHDQGAAMAECYEFMYGLDDEEEEVYMTSYYDHLEEIASYEPPAVDIDPDESPRVLSNSFKFKRFYDGFGFSPATRLEMTKAIVAIADGGREACMAEGGSIPRTVREESNTISFSDADRKVQFAHNRPLFVTATIGDVELRRAFLDGGASINIMPMETFKKLGIPESKIVKSLVGIMGFGGEKKPSLGYVVVDLAVGPIRAATKFHVIEGSTNYHVILGRSWMHKYAAVPSSYHQCLKAIWAGRKVTINATEKPFEACEAHLSDAVYFSEVEEACEAVTSKPRGVKLPKWEDIKNDEGEASTEKRNAAVVELAPARKILRTSEGGRLVYSL